MPKKFTNKKRPSRRRSNVRRIPHHYEYTSGTSVHEHLNRIHASNKGAYVSSHQDEAQRQLMHKAAPPAPANYMHVSSNELAIPAPLMMKKMQKGMRMFTSV